MNVLRIGRQGIVSTKTAARAASALQHSKKKTKKHLIDTWIYKYVFARATLADADTAVQAVDGTTSRTRTGALHSSMTAVSLVARLPFGAFPRPLRD